MEQIGWFVVGEGNFGPYLFDVKRPCQSPLYKGHCPPFISSVDEIDEITYWKNRGYDIIPAYINANDKEDYSFVEENNDISS